jgi:hypothetical protein
MIPHCDPVDPDSEAIDLRVHDAVPAKEQALESVASAARDVIAAETVRDGMIKLAVTTHGASLREVSQAAGLAPVAIKRILRQQLAGELA